MQENWNAITQANSHLKGTLESPNKNKKYNTFTKTKYQNHKNPPSVFF